jgi:hypothetical protein
MKADTCMGKGLHQLYPEAQKTRHNNEDKIQNSTLTCVLKVFRWVALSMDQICLISFT